MIDKRISGNGARPFKLIVMGASPNSTNCGVAALGTACVDNLYSLWPDAHIIVGMGGVTPKAEVELADGTIPVEATWLKGSTAVKHRGSTRHLRWLHRLRGFVPGLGTSWLPNRTFRQLMEADAVLDLAGGDSFADTYTRSVFASQVAVKQLAIEMGKPLIVLPQTIGPFRSPATQRIARDILSDSALVATREKFGLEELERLMGRELDNRFVRCPDVAFTLRPKPPTERPKLWADSREGPIIGLNVSGLLWDSNVDFGLASDYRTLINRLIDWAMAMPDTRLLLVPHVFNKSRVAAKGGFAVRDGLIEGSELEIALRLRDELVAKWGDRVAAVEQPYQAAQLKWLIGHCDFFVGARMHACIAAVSQAIPTVTLAYSKKAAGVMGMLDPAPPVVDLRQAPVNNVLMQIDRAFQDRQALQQSLRSAVSDAQTQVREFFSVQLQSMMERHTSAKQQQAASVRNH